MTQSFPERAGILRDEVSSALEQHGTLGDGCPIILQDAILYSLTAPGKRLRPILVLLAAEACGSTMERAMPAACAIEMIHAYSLIHDDLPAMDDDDLRRGQPTCHVKFGEANAILAGDALLTQAFSLIAEHIRPPEVSARCVAVLSRAAGAGGMVGGQVDDLALEQRVEDGDEGSAIVRLESIHRRKTGALFTAAPVLGGVISDASDSRLDSLRSFGEKLGLAFQITDDLLDVAGDELATGKRVGKDSPRGKLTYPSLFGVEKSRQLAAETVDAACGALAEFGPPAADLVALARFVLERNH